MAMCNSAFHKLCNEWNANYEYNEVFREYVDSLGIRLMSHNMPLKSEDAVKIRKDYKKMHKIWFRIYDDAYVYIDMMPMGTRVGDEIPGFLEWQKNNKIL